MGIPEWAYKVEGNGCLLTENKIASVLASLILI
jgi:hypothetical protein